MDSSTGDLYPSMDAARDAGVSEDDLVLLRGPEPAVRAISDAVKAQRKRERKAARASRKRNR